MLMYYQNPLVTIVEGGVSLPVTLLAVTKLTTGFVDNQMGVHVV